MKTGQTITVYNTDSYNSELIPDKAPFQAVVLELGEGEALVKSVATGKEYWLYLESFEVPPQIEINWEALKDIVPFPSLIEDWINLKK